MGAEVLEQVKEERLHYESRKGVQEEKGKERILEHISKQRPNETAEYIL